MYIINKNTEKVNKVKEISELAYKQLYYETLKEANDFLRNVYKTDYDNLGLQYSLETLDEERELKSNLKKTIEEIEKKDNYMKDVPGYPNGFVNSEEWYQRRLINSYYKYYNYLFVSEVIAAKEKILEKVIPDYPLNRKIKNKYVDDLLFTGRITWYFNKPGIRELLAEFSQKIKPVSIQIHEQEMAYENLVNKTRIENSTYKKLKDYLLADLTRKERLDRKLYELETLHQSHCSLIDFIEKKNLHSLKIEDIKFSQEKGYNLFVIRENSCKQIVHITSLNGRLCLIDRDNMLVINEDIILVDKKNNGERVDLPPLEFYNYNQIDYTRRIYAKSK